MTLKTTNSAESWSIVEQAVHKINFVAYDYYSIKNSIIEYLQMYYKESFNNFIESTNLIAYIESFAIVGELLAYRADINANENFITHAQRKANVLKLAKFLSYNASRNVCARGMVKLTSIRTNEDIIDSQGVNLSGRKIIWNDPNNMRWKEHFNLIMNRALYTNINNPIKSIKIADIKLLLYTINNIPLTNNVFRYNVTVNSNSYPMELVNCDIDDFGMFETHPGQSSLFNIVYSEDGLGDTSDNTGWMFYTKQGILSKNNYTITGRIPDRYLDINLNNINETDVWLSENINGENRQWYKVDVINNQNIYFNTEKNKNKFQVVTLEDDRVRLVFGNGDYGEIPEGNFDIWVRQSANQNIVIAKNNVVDVPFSIGYYNEAGVRFSLDMTFSLTSALNNSSTSESIEHIRSAAPASYYSQNRMVNAQDYNTYLLRDSSVLKIKAINRTFAGQPKWIEWNDASGAYQNVKVFGDDLRLYLNFDFNTYLSTISSRKLIDEELEPIIKKNEFLNILNYIGLIDNSFIFPEEIDKTRIVSNPRNRFLEEKIGNKLILEKTDIQGKLDKHYYGEVDTYYTINQTKHAYVGDDADYKIYDQYIARTVDGLSSLEGGNGSGLQNAVQILSSFAIAYKRYSNIIGNGFIKIDPDYTNEEQLTIECINNNGPVFTVISDKNGYLGKIDKLDTYFELNNHKIIIKEGSKSFELGDAFICNITNNKEYYAAVNLLGRFTVENMNRTNEYSNWEKVNNWVMTIVKNEKPNGEFLNWEISYKTLNLVAESPTTKFWYNDYNNIIDNDTQNKVTDKIIILKANLDKYNVPLLENKKYDVIGGLSFDNGQTNNNALKVMPSDATNQYISGDDYPDNPLQFYQFINLNDYVYFEEDNNTKVITPINKDKRITAIYTVEGLFNTTNDMKIVKGSKTFHKRIGKDNINFMWQHFSSKHNVIDPSTSNIIDMYILTKGYYESMNKYLRGLIDEPKPESSLQLMNSYKHLLMNKLESDTIICHSAKIKPLFGKKAEPQLRGKFRLIKKQSSLYTDEQLRYDVVNIIYNYFDISSLEFGQSLYVNDLCAKIHNELSEHIHSIVLVPLFKNNYYGDLLIIECGENELLQGAVDTSDIEIVSTYNAEILKQKL